MIRLSHTNLDEFLWNIRETRQPRVNAKRPSGIKECKKKRGKP